MITPHKYHHIPAGSLILVLTNYHRSNLHLLLLYFSIFVCISPTKGHLWKDFEFYKEMKNWSETTDMGNGEWDSSCKAWWWLYNPGFQFPPYCHAGHWHILGIKTSQYCDYWLLALYTQRSQTGFLLSENWWTIMIILSDHNFLKYQMLSYLNKLCSRSFKISV